MSGAGGAGPDGRQGPGPRARALLAQARAEIDEGRPDAALPVLREALGLTPGDAQVHGELGRAFNNLRRLPEAIAALGDAVRLAPEDAELWNRMGHVCRAAGDLDAAGSAFRRALALRPRYPLALANLASVFLARGEADEGLRLLQQAVDSDPGAPEWRCRLGDALQSLGRGPEAEAAYAAALESDPEHEPALAGLGALMEARGRHREAERHLTKALRIRPQDPVAMASLVHVLELQGRAEEVLSLVDGAGWTRAPAWAELAAARQLFRLGRPEAAARRLDPVEAELVDPRTRAAALNLRAWLLDDKGEHGAAFQTFQAANDARPGVFDPAGFRLAVDRLVRFFTRERLDSLPVSGCDSERPVLIVGMPRSGTSLVEQILSAHPRVVACGERTDLYRLPRELSGGDPAGRWPECLADLGPEVLSRAAGRYLEDAGTAGSDTLRATDKLPANFLNLGLVQLLFPRARVVYCRRDAMDAGLSCFQQDFQSPGMDFARDLGHIGLYQQGCRRLMDHWRRVLSLPIHVVDYERLVSEPEASVRALVAFLGLDWQDACLRFHESERVVRTASHGQVRRPLYESSVGRWRRYEAWLGPLREALEKPWEG